MKNPFLSMWLSGANTATNAWLGTVRGYWTAEQQRQQAAMINAMTKETVKFWAGFWGLMPPPRR